jgi:hypothetical protein
MKTAIGIGGRVLPVLVERTDEGFTASYSARVAGEMQFFMGSAETYDGALQDLRTKIVAVQGS